MREVTNNENLLIKGVFIDKIAQFIDNKGQFVD